MPPTTPIPRSGPLSGLRVLDLTRVVAGPYATQILGDLGAEVIKVERRTSGDDIRRVAPPWVRPPGPETAGESTYFQAVNRNKRSITVDFTRPHGASVIKRLAAMSDVFIENYRPGTLAKYGLSYDELSRLKPSMIYCSITGFGQNGPYSGRSAYDFLVQGMAGLLSVTGHPDGEPGAEPIRVGIPIADILAGMNGVIAVLAALHHRDHTGEGQWIDISLFESQVAGLLNSASAWLNAGELLGRTGNDHPSAAPYGMFRVHDGHIIIATFNDREFARLAIVLGHPEWIEHPHFARNSDRVLNRAEVNEAITKALRGKGRSEWVREFNEAMIPAGPINDVSDLEKDPQVVARELFVSLASPELGLIRSVASPLRMSRTPCDYKWAPPALGEHSAEVLVEAGYTVDEIQRLREEEIL